MFSFHLFFVLFETVSKNSGGSDSVFELNNYINEGFNINNLMIIDSG